MEETEAGSINIQPRDTTLKIDFHDARLGGFVCRLYGLRVCLGKTIAEILNKPNLS